MWYRVILKEDLSLYPDHVLVLKFYNTFLCHTMLNPLTLYGVYLIKERNLTIVSKIDYIQNYVKELDLNYWSYYKMSLDMYHISECPYIRSDNEHTYMV